jgi:hypothetical protein
MLSIAAAEVKMLDITYLTHKDSCKLFSPQSFGGREWRMGNLFSEWWQRVSHTWKTELLSSVLIAIATFLIGRDVQSLIHALEAVALVMGAWLAYHAARVLWKVRIITGLRKGDPRIEATFIDERKEVLAVPRSAALELKNRGPSDALWVRISPLRLQKRTLYFPHISDVIAPTDFERFHADVGSQWGYDSNHDLIQAMNEEWVSHGDRTHREIILPMLIHYEDAQGVHYELSFQLLYHGGKGWNQPADFKCIECREFTYRRIVPGGFMPYKGNL